MARRRNRGNRFRLIVYERMWQRWALLCTLLVPASVVLWWAAPRISILYPAFRSLTLVPGGVAIVILVYAFLARRLAWVQCRAGHIRIQTPFYRLAVSYGRIKGTRPRSFAEMYNLAEEKVARQDWLRPYARHTAIVINLSRYPLSRAWLRLWFSPYLLDPVNPGFVFLVEDWMALSRQVDEFRIAWETRRKERRKEPRIRYLR